MGRTNLLASVGLALVVASACGGADALSPEAEEELILSQWTSEPPPNALAVTDLIGKGDERAQWFAYAFGRAVGERLLFAPKTFTLQPTAADFEQRLVDHGACANIPLPEAVVCKLAAAFGLRHIIGGVWTQAGDDVSVVFSVADVNAGGARSLPALKGNIQQAAELETRAALQLIDELHLPCTPEQRAWMARPQPVRAECWEVYGHGRSDSRFDPHWLERTATYRAHLDTRFASRRRLDAMDRLGVMTSQEKAEYGFDKQLTEATAGWLDVPDIALHRARHLWRQGYSEKARAAMDSVIEADPGYVSALQCRAIRMERSEEAHGLEVARSAVRLWPGSAANLWSLAAAHLWTANSARMWRYYSEMSPAEERTWRSHAAMSLAVALRVVEADPDNYEGWKLVGSGGRSFGYRALSAHAFENRRRIRPKELEVYWGRAGDFEPQWGGTAEEQESVLRLADKQFGVGSAEALTIRAYAMLGNRPKRKYVTRAIEYSRAALKKAKEGSDVWLTAQQLNSLAESKSWLADEAPAQSPDSEGSNN